MKRYPYILKEIIALLMLAIWIITSVQMLLLELGGENYLGINKVGLLIGNLTSIIFLLLLFHLIGQGVLDSIEDNIISRDKKNIKKE